MLRGRRYGFSVMAENYKSMFSSSSVKMSDHIHNFPSTCSIGSYDANTNGWDGTFLCNKEGNYAHSKSRPQYLEKHSILLLPISALAAKSAAKV